MVCGSRNDIVVTTSRRSRTVVEVLVAYSHPIEVH